MLENKNIKEKHVKNCINQKLVLRFEYLDELIYNKVTGTRPEKLLKYPSQFFYNN